jgi:VanZ family protein
MTQTHRRLALAVAVSIILVVAAPFVGVVRSQIRAAFPGQFGTIINGIVAAALAAALVWALARIRTHRLARYGAVALAFAAGIVYSRATDSPDSSVRAVEHFHFVEYGLITFFYYRAWRERLDLAALVLPLVAAFLVGIADEAVQWFIPARVGELNDVWLNGVAIGCGLLFGAGFEPPAPFRAGWRPGSRRLTGNLVALTLVALAAFVWLVHLGVEIRDNEIGAFGSRYTAAQLAALGADRAERWKADPPTTRPPRLSREDQYMTEGLQHVQARNLAWDAGDAFTAWRENLILEKWFAPVLDTPSYVSPTGHRWNAEHRADAASRVAGTERRPFVSRAYPYPLFYWPALRLWLAAVVAAGVLVLAGLADRPSAG